MRKYLDIPTEFPTELHKVKFYLDTDTFELSLSLFEKCNLKCKFCFEDHLTKDIDLAYIHNIPNEIFARFLAESEKYTAIKNINIRIWGGELFFDSLPDIMFNEYKLLVDEISNKFKQYDSTLIIRYSWLTNGVFEKYDRVLDLLKYSNGTISFSYDPIGRFSNDTQLDQMLRCYAFFKQHNLINSISITLTKQTIYAYIEGKSHIDMFKGSFFDINFYTPNPGWENLMLSPDDIYAFFKWAYDNNYLEFDVVKNCINTVKGIQVPKYCDCKTTIQYSKGICTNDCAIRASTLEHSRFYGKYDKYVTEDNCNEIKASYGMQKLKCLQCKYYQNCQMPCWITVIFDMYDTTYCPYYRFYEYLQHKLKK